MRVIAQCGLPLQAPMSTQSKPVYANFSVYKGKAALSLRVGPTHFFGFLELEQAEACIG